ncbi:MAG: CPBP family glutamic-type intramembrane protease [Fimbriimonas sp.]
MRIEALLHDRLADVRAAILTFPTGRTWLQCLLVYAVFAAIALSLGLGSGLLRPSLAELSPKTFALLAITTLLSPSLMEEVIFRVLPLPRDATRVTEPRFALISTVSLVAFVAAHPLSAWLLRPAAWALFTSPEFLAIAALLGAACTAVYLISKSLWPPLLLHWTAVLTWITLLGGQALLKG